MIRSPKVDQYISEQPNWEQINLATFRDLVHNHAHNLEEDIKWGVPVFLIDGKTLFAMSTFKAYTKYNFFNGASLNNDELFNNGLNSKKYRSIDLKKDESINKNKLKVVINEAINNLEGT